MKRKCLLCLAALACSFTLLTACGGDVDDSPSGSGGIITTEDGDKILLSSITDNSNDKIMFFYDEQGRPTYSYCWGDFKLYIDYDPYQITSDNEDETISLSFNSAGYVSKMSVSEEWVDSSHDYGSSSSNISFSYDSNGHLTKASGSENETEVYYDESETYNASFTATFTWEKGNLTKAVINDESDEDGEKYSEQYTYDFAYSDEVNEYKQPLQAFWDLLDGIHPYVCDLTFVGYFGIGTANLPTSYDETDLDLNTGKERTYTTALSYTTNSDGTIKTEKTGTRTTYTYAYETLETRSEAPRGQEYNSNEETPRHRSLPMHRHRHHADE